MVAAPAVAHQHHLEDMMNGSGPRARRGEAQAHLLQMVATGDRSSGCWEWPFARNKLGYGLVRFDGRTWLAHRLTYQLATGTTPDVCRHQCDNPPCTNPGHLLDGTVLDNARDSCERGQQPVGERIGRSKLREADVTEMRRLARAGEPILAMAHRFGVSRETVYQSVTGMRWRHVSEPPVDVPTHPTASPCGTVAAYRRHLRRGQEPCPLCRAANSLTSRARRRGD